MSQHHRRTKHTTYSTSLREQIAKQLPLPCVECGRPVLPEQTWHLAHLVAASQGGRTTRTNTGPAHARCNLKAGGRMGAAVVNARRRAEMGRRAW